VFERLERALVRDRDALVARDPERDVPPLVLRVPVLERRVRRRRVVVARWLLGIAALTTSLTSRVSSASKNLAMRSSSRRIALAS
jgi:hypothetical protein